MDTKPIVSVILSVYNAEDVVRNAIKSILKQTFKQFEFIIINDGSTDTTKSILEDFASIDPRIKIINQENIGLTKSLNKGVKLAKGEFIARQDADDISFPERLEKQLEYLKLNNDVKLLGTNQWIQEKETRRLGRYQKKSELNKSLFYRSPFAHTSVMFSKKCFEEIGMYNESFDTSQDFEAWMRFAKKHSVDMLEEPLVIRTLSSSSISSRKSNRQAYNAFRARMLHNPISFQLIFSSLYQLLIPYIPNIIMMIKKRIVNNTYLLNGDHKLSKKELLYYFITNLIVYIASMFSLNVFKFRIKSFICSNVSQKASPLRDYIKDYLNVYIRDLPKGLTYLDIGCGNGMVFNTLSELKQEGHYHGIDITESEVLKKKIIKGLSKELTIISAENLDQIDLPKFDRIISVTSLEHIHNDSKVIENTSKLENSNAEQLHIVPTGFSLFLYLNHGWRQYNKDMIYRLFEGKGSFTVEKGGGLFSSFLHFFTITLPNKTIKRTLPNVFPQFYYLLKYITIKLDPLLPLCAVVYFIRFKSFENN